MNNDRRMILWLVGIDIVLLTFLAIILIYIMPCTQDWIRSTGDPHKWLLSATAQVLGALFALVFSAILIAAQLVTKYTHRIMKIIFDLGVIVFISFFASSVILPLWCLSNPTGLGSFMSIAYGSSMMILLIPFFLDLRRRMNVEWAIEILRRKALKAVPDNLNRVQENIETLDIISTGAFKSGDTGAFEKAVEARIEILSEICEHL